MSPQSIEILLVEDNPYDIELAQHAFAKHNFVNHLEVAVDGQAALDYLLAADTVLPRLILLDLKLPKVDGLQVLREIRSNPTLRHVPVVILTSSREERDIIDGYARGVNSYIVKPIQFDKFVEMAQTLGLYWMLLNEPPIAATAGQGAESS